MPSRRGCARVSTNTRDSFPARNDDRYSRPPPPGRRNLFQTGSGVGLASNERRASLWAGGGPRRGTTLVVLRRRGWESPLFENGRHENHVSGFPPSCRVVGEAGGGEEDEGRASERATCVCGCIRVRVFMHVYTHDERSCMYVYMYVRVFATTAGE